MADENNLRAGEDSPASPGSPLLEHAQAAFMEWIKVVEYDLGVSEGHFEKCEKALRSGDLETFGHHFGKSWGHLQNALKTVRSATHRGFDAGNDQGEARHV